MAEVLKRYLIKNDVESLYLQEDEIQQLKSVPISGPEYQHVIYILADYETLENAEKHKNALGEGNCIGILENRYCLFYDEYDIEDFLKKVPKVLKHNCVWNMCEKEERGPQTYDKQDYINFLEGLLQEYVQ